MNINYKIPYTLIAASIFVFTVNAQPGERGELRKQEIKEERKELKETKISEKAEIKKQKRIETCNSVSEKIVNRKTQIEKLSLNYKSSINRIETNLNLRVTKLKTTGKDTSEIETNLLKFKNDSQSLLEKYNQILTNLSNINTSGCQTDKNAFVTNVRSFNATLKTQMEAQNTLRKFVRDNIVSKLKVLEGANNE